LPGSQYTFPCSQKVERLKDSLHFLVDRPLNNHTIFKDTEKELREFDAAEHFDTAPELAGRAYNRPRLETLKNTKVTAPKDTKIMRKAIKEGAKQYQELSQRVDRMGKLDSVLSHQQTTKNVMVSAALQLMCDLTAMRVAIGQGKET
jgi:U3 small nucleolar RNA-associated protein 11